MDRRDFLKRSALGIAGAIVGGGVVGGLTGVTTGCTPGAAKKRIGLQLYSLRDAMREDPQATLAAVAAMGYTDLENASYSDGKIYGFTPAEFRKIVEDLGMKVTSCHIGGGGQQTDEWWAKAIADHKALGCKYIVVPSIRLGSTIADMDELCAYFNKAAATCKAQGIIFGYHNHANEFKPIEGQVWMDYIIQNTSSDVAIELDVYWAVQGGVDPAAYIKKYPGRFPLLHIKDDSVIGDSGKIDFQPIFEAAYAQGMEDYYVEVEQYSPYPPEASVERSFTFLESASYVK